MYMHTPPSSHPNPSSLHRGNAAIEATCTQPRATLSHHSQPLPQPAHVAVRTVVNVLVWSVVEQVANAAVIPAGCTPGEGGEKAAPTDKEPQNECTGAQKGTAGKREQQGLREDDLITANRHDRQHTTQTDDAAGRRPHSHPHRRESINPHRTDIHHNQPIIKHETPGKERK